LSPQHVFDSFYHKHPLLVAYAARLPNEIIDPLPNDIFSCLIVELQWLKNAPERKEQILNLASRMDKGHALQFCQKLKIRYIYLPEEFAANVPLRSFIERLFPIAETYVEGKSLLYRLNQE
jgi:hypothetical protein